ncbi:MAG: DUF4276 family protein [Planctomycetaceae bacterium]|jgi:hypothetical protein|nr:DUF4276 family protein [Planctomycetaceae bacterium]
MKLGLILECPPNGTDHKVYDYVIHKLCTSLEITVIPTGTPNKSQMIKNCGNIAYSLLKLEHCDTVAIIWDLMPTWGGKPCRKEDVDKIKTSLNDANVDLSKIKFICIEPELEGWMIADGSALTRYKEKICFPHSVNKFENVRQSNNNNDSKKRISKYLERKYNDIIDAIKIVELFDNFDKVAKKHTSFRRLKKFIEELYRSR